MLKTAEKRDSYYKRRFKHVDIDEDLLYVNVSVEKCCELQHEWPTTVNECF